MTEKPVQQKIIAIDLLRAFAAMGVFYYHNHSGALIAKYSGMPFLKLSDAFGATYAVPLFFLLSGYCIHSSNIKYIKLSQRLPLKEYYTRRFLRIYPPYFVALLFSLIINYSILPNYEFNKNDFLIHLFSLQGFSVPYFNTINVVLWTITTELAFYFIYPIFYYIRLKYNLNYALIFTLIVSCISIAYYSFKTDITPPQRFCVFNLWFAWCCGAFLADKKILNPDDLKQPVYKAYYLFILIAAICFNTISNSLYIIFDQFNILFWTAPLMFILSKENWFRDRKKSLFIKIFSAIGLSSYSLYLLHQPLITLKNFLAHKYLPTSLQTAGVFTGIFLIPVVAWFSYRYIETLFTANRHKLPLKA